MKAKFINGIALIAALIIAIPANSQSTTEMRKSLNEKGFLHDGFGAETIVLTKGGVAIRQAHTLIDSMLKRVEASPDPQRLETTRQLYNSYLKLHSQYESLGFFPNTNKEALFKGNAASLRDIAQSRLYVSKQADVEKRDSLKLEYEKLLRANSISESEANATLNALKRQAEASKKVEDAKIEAQEKIDEAEKAAMNRKSKIQLSISKKENEKDAVTSSPSIQEDKERMASAKEGNELLRDLVQSDLAMAQDLLKLDESAQRAKYKPIMDKYGISSLDELRVKTEELNYDIGDSVLEANRKLVERQENRILTLENLIALNQRSLKEIEGKDKADIAKRKAKLQRHIDMLEGWKKDAEKEMAKVKKDMESQISDLQGFYDDSILAQLEALGISEEITESGEIRRLAGTNLVVTNSSEAPIASDRILIKRLELEHQNEALGSYGSEADKAVKNSSKAK